MPRNAFLTASEILNHMNSLCHEKKFLMAEQIGETALSSNPTLSDNDKLKIQEKIDEINILLFNHEINANPDQFEPTTPPSTPRSP